MTNKYLMCKVCGDFEEFKYIGTMDYGEFGVYNFYNCQKCHDTITQKSKLEEKLGDNKKFKDRT